MTPAATAWNDASAILRAEINEAVWQSTFALVDPVTIDNRDFVLAVPNVFLKEKIDGRYRTLVEDAVTTALGGPRTIIIEVATSQLFDLAEPVDLARQEPPKAETGGSGTNGVAGSPPGDSRYSFETFVTGPSNRFAHAAALAVAERPAGSYNPLFIYGSAGLGKTHLLKAIQHYVMDVYPSMSVQYVSTETFLNEFVDSIRNSSGNQFKRRYRNIDVLLVDDIQFIEGKDGLQEEFFHTFNDLYGANKQIVLSSDRPPDRIPTLEDRLRSRFMMGLLTDIQPPDIETRMAILHRKADRDGYYLPSEVSEFIAEHITSNIRELEGAINKVTAYASLNELPMNRELAERVLGDFIAARQPRPITIEMILEATSDQFGFSRADLIGRSRRRPLVTARQVAMYVSRELTDHSYPIIAREFGDRDHTTVMYACDKIAALMKERSQIFDQVTALEKTVRTRAESGE